uniref:Uncharacterized protein n=1 Tax=Anguilla anguilla TaxID=7936 RepID=A0A0E9W5W2_ANGAN
MSFESPVAHTCEITVLGEDSATCQFEFETKAARIYIYIYIHCVSQGISIYHTAATERHRFGNLCCYVWLVSYCLICIEGVLC